MRTHTHTHSSISECVTTTVARLSSVFHSYPPLNFCSPFLFLSLPPFYAPFTPQDLLPSLVYLPHCSDPSTSPRNRLTHFLFSSLFMCRHYSVRTVRIVSLHTPCVDVTIHTCSSCLLKGWAPNVGECVFNLPDRCLCQCNELLDCVHCNLVVCVC